MFRVLVAGILSYDESKKNLYVEINKVCYKFVKEISSPLDMIHFKGSDFDFYKKMFSDASWADLVIAEVSDESIYVGMQIRESVYLNKSLLVLSKEIKGERIPGFILSAPNLCGIIYYKNIDDLKEKLGYFFERMKTSKSEEETNN